MPEHHLPSEIVTDLLSRLRVKPLLRLRCVSKPWCALIDSPDFIKTHLNRSIQTKTQLTLILTDPGSADPNLYAIDFDSLDKPVNPDPPIKPSNHHTQVWGSSNGLICLANLEKDVVLWNPSTKRHCKLPFAPIEPVTPMGLFAFELVVYGFGFDKMSDDYKVVRIVQLLDDDHVHSDVRVYSLKSNSWNRVRDFPCNLSRAVVPGLLANGALHWEVTEKSTHDDPPIYIIGFDLGTEGFHLLHLPEFNKYYTDYRYKLGVLDASLCFICGCYQVGIDVWVMKEYGVKESWTKLFTIEHSNVISSIDVLVPITYSKNGRKVLFQRNYQRFLWYDLDTKTTEKVRVRNMPNEFEVNLCLDSLVTLGDGGGVSDRKKPAAQDETKKEINGKKRDGFLSKGFKLKL